MKAGKIARVALEAATLYVVQVALAFIPNCELVSTMVIIYTLVFGPEVFLAVEIFAFVEIATYGLGLWNIIYLYIWPILVLITILLKNIIGTRWILWSVVCGLFGLLFGTLCALEYLVIDRSLMITYWISGVPWDIWHGFTNFMMMTATGKILYSAMTKVSKHSFE